MSYGLAVIKPQLTKLLLLGNDHDGEVVSTARAIERARALPHWLSQPSPKQSTCLAAIADRLRGAA
jgi:hypothetical protein